MSWLYSRALVEAYSAGTCSDGEPCAPSSGTPMPQAYCAPDKMTEFSRLFRFGMTFAPLTEDRGEAVLTSFLADFPAKISASRAEVRESTESDPACGRTWRGSFARWDRGTSSWKTRQPSLFEGLIESSVTWPRWGTMQDGACSAQPTPERRTFESGFGSWLPTPTTIDTGSRFNRSKSKNAATRPTLGAMAKFSKWPIPTAHDAKDSGRSPSEARRNSPGLAFQALTRQTWPTPTASDSASGGAQWSKTQMTLTTAVLAPNGERLPETRGGSLNPTWVEWLMGWPLGWTALEPLGTGRFQQWQRSHGIR